MKIINVEDLTKVYSIKSNIFSKEKDKNVEALKNVTFSVEEGDCIGILGENGSGKTTLIKTLTGLLKKSNGIVEVCGFKPDEGNNDFKKKIGLMLGQKSQLIWSLPSMDSYNLNRFIYQIDKKTYQRRLDYLVESMKIEDIINTPVRSLSLGQRMTCEFVLSLIHKPEILFLDEPTIGLDLINQRKIRKFLKNYNTKENNTIVLTSHNMSDIESICNKVILLDHGEIVYYGAINDFINDFDDEVKYKVSTYDDYLKFNNHHIKVKKQSENNFYIYINKEHTELLNDLISEIKNIKNFSLVEKTAEDVLVSYYDKK